MAKRDRCHDYLPDAIGQCEQLRSLTIRGGHWREVRRLKIPPTVQKLALLDCQSLHGDLLAWLSLDEQRSPALETFAVTLLDSTTSPVGLRLEEVIDSLQAAGVAMLPSDDAFARGPSVVRQKLVVPRAHASQVGPRPAWMSTRYRWARAIR